MAYKERLNAKQLRGRKFYNSKFQDELDARRQAFMDYLRAPTFELDLFYNFYQIPSRASQLKSEHPYLNIDFCQRIVFFHHGQYVNIKSDFVQACIDQDYYDDSDVQKLCDDFRVKVTVTKDDHRLSEIELDVSEAIKVAERLTPIQGETDDEWEEVQPLDVQHLPEASIVSVVCETEKPTATSTHLTDKVYRTVTSTEKVQSVKPIASVCESDICPRLTLKVIDQVVDHAKSRSKPSQDCVILIGDEHVIGRAKYIQPQSLPSQWYSRTNSIYITRSVSLIRYALRLGKRVLISLNCFKTYSHRKLYKLMTCGATVSGRVVIRKVGYADGDNYV